LAATSDVLFALFLNLCFLLAVVQSSCEPMLENDLVLILLADRYGAFLFENVFYSFDSSFSPGKDQCQGEEGKSLFVLME